MRTAQAAKLRNREGLARRAPCARERSTEQRPDRDGPSGVGSLDEVLTAAWTGLRADAPIACPICDAVMEPQWSAGAGVVAGLCRDCGSELS